MRPRPFLLALVLCLAMAACGGGDPPARAAPGASGEPGSSSTPAADPDVVGLFRACHRTRGGSLILVFLFEDHDPARAADAGNGFVVTPVTPTKWSATGAPVEVDPGYNDHVRQIAVPPGQLAPDEIVLHVEVQTTATGAALAANDVTVFVPSSSCATA